MGMWGGRGELENSFPPHRALRGVDVGSIFAAPRREWSNPLRKKIFTGGPISSKNNWCDDTAQVLRDLTRTQQPWESGAKKTSVNVSEHG